MLSAANTTVPLNLTITTEIILANASCDKAWSDALIAKFDEERRKAAAADGLAFNSTTTVVSCKKVSKLL
jgi:hypothetical protein